jgi:monothiol glutaredoxin
MSNTREKIHAQLAENPIIIYMKGVPSAPECGFSARTVAILNTYNIPYSYVDVLKAPFIREKLPSISKWPTFPQLFVNGELIGGCDIVEAMNQNGSLLPVLQSAIKAVAGNSNEPAISHSEVQAMIIKAYPDAKVSIKGEACNLEIEIISEMFTDLPLIKQHQRVMEALEQPLSSGRLHAVTLKTYTQEQWRSQQTVTSQPLLQIQL